jgi:hypothetical protein
MKQRRDDTIMDREGFALTTTLLIVLVLTVLAVAAAWVASTERRTGWAESVHISSLFSADAGTESSINFLRLSETPPKIIDFGDMSVRNQGTTPIMGAQEFEYDCRFVSKRPKPGWGVEFLDYEYDIVSRGAATDVGRAAVQCVAGRLYQEGY